MVFHLFGKLSAVPDYAVTEEDTLEFIHSLQNETKRPQRLFDELNQAHLFIVGCSVTEWLARFFLRISRRDRLLLARGKTDIVADARVRDDAGLMLLPSAVQDRHEDLPGRRSVGVRERTARAVDGPPPTTGERGAPIERSPARPAWKTARSS